MAFTQELAKAKFSIFHKDVESPIGTQAQMLSVSGLFGKGIGL